MLALMAAGSGDDGDFSLEPGLLTFLRLTFHFSAGLLFSDRTHGEAPSQVLHQHFRCRNHQATNCDTDLTPSRRTGGNERMSPRSHTWQLRKQ